MVRLLRSIVPVVVGAAAGAAGMWVFLGSGSGGAGAAPGESGFIASVARLASGRDIDSGRVAPSVTERLSAYRGAQARTDAGEIERLLAAAAAGPMSPARDLEVDALLARLSELAPATAVSAALNLGLDRPFVVDAFVLWAERNVAAALTGLGTLDSAGLRREVALALLEVAGNDAGGLERVAAALPASDRDGLTVDWLAQRAEYDPYGALREAMTLVDTTLQTDVLSAIAVAWTAQDPTGALAQADLLPGRSADAFRRAVYTEWARLDSATLINHIATLANPPDAISAAMPYLIASDPERALEALAAMPGGLGEAMRLSALSEIAARDPEAAKARLAAMPAGMDRDRLAQAIAQGLAQQDPEAALAWVENLEPPSPDAMRSVALAVAQKDLTQALDLLDRPTLAGDANLILSLATTIAARDPGQAENVANRLLAQDNLQARAALQNLISNWMQRDPERALDWVLASGTEVDPVMLRSAAQGVAQRDPIAAAAFVDRLPERHRPAWIVQVAGQYGRADPAGAAAWLDRYQGQDFHAAAYRDVLVNAAQTDPSLAASLLLQAGPDVQRGAAATVALALAQSEPRGAANWAQALRDPQASSQALAGAVGAWADNDISAARNWALALPSGEQRDQSLVVLLQRSARNGDFNDELLRAVSTDAERLRALQTSIPVLARTDPDRARELVEREINDANLRRQLESQIEQMRSLSSQISVF